MCVTCMPHVQHVQVVSDTVSLLTAPSCPALRWTVGLGGQVVPTSQRRNEVGAGAAGWTEERRGTGGWGEGGEGAGGRGSEYGRGGEGGVGVGTSERRSQLIHIYEREKREAEEWKTHKHKILLEGLQLTKWERDKRERERERERERTRKHYFTRIVKRERERERERERVREREREREKKRKKEEEEEGEKEAERIETVVTV